MKPASAWERTVNAAFAPRSNGKVQSHVKLTDPRYRDTAKRHGLEIGKAKPLSFAESVSLRLREGTDLTPAQRARLTLAAHGLKPNGTPIPAPKPVRTKAPEMRVKMVRTVLHPSGTQKTRATRRRTEGTVSNARFRYSALGERLPLAPNTGGTILAETRSRLATSTARGASAPMHDNRD